MNLVGRGISPINILLYGWFSLLTRNWRDEEQVIFSQKTIPETTDSPGATDSPREVDLSQLRAFSGSQNRIPLLDTSHNHGNQWKMVVYFQ